MCLGLSDTFLWLFEFKKDKYLRISVKSDLYCVFVIKRLLEKLCFNLQFVILRIISISLNSLPSHEKQNIFTYFFNKIYEISLKFRTLTGFNLALFFYPGRPWLTLKWVPRSSTHPIVQHIILTQNGHSLSAPTQKSVSSKQKKVSSTHSSVRHKKRNRQFNTKNSQFNTPLRPTRKNCQFSP